MNELFLPHNISSAERERVYAELAQYPGADIDNAEYIMKDSTLWLILPDKDARIRIMPPEPQKEETFGEYTERMRDEEMLDISLESERKLYGYLWETHPQPATAAGGNID